MHLIIHGKQGNSVIITSAIILIRTVYSLSKILQSFPVNHSTVEHEPSSPLPSNLSLSFNKRFKRSGLFEPPSPVPITKDLVQGYKIIRKRLDWKEAQDYCERTTGHLAAFLDEKDADLAIEALHKLSAPYTEQYDKGVDKEEYGLDRRYWIGLSDFMEEGQWEWVGRGKKLSYTTKWYPSQPDHIYPNGKLKSGRLQHCVSLWNPGYFKSQKHTFDDLECDRKLYFICEEDSTKVAAIKDKLNKAGYVDDTLLP